MSQDASIKIKIETDQSNLESGYRKAEASTNQFVNKTNKSLSNLKTGSNEAGQALTNLGRVAQDAPYGLIGIANNLNPLLESFQRLKTTTGTAGGALKALAGSLVGGGGLGIALSLITAAVSFASVGFGSWTRGLKGSQAALDENAKSAKEAADAYKGIVSSVAEESGKIQILVEQLKNENITRAQRAEAIKQLQQLSPAYFSTLNKEKSTIEDVTQAYNLYNNSLIRNINARARENALIDITEKIIKLQNQGGLLARDQVLVDGKLVKVNNARLDTMDNINASANNYKEFMRGSLFLTKQEQQELDKLLITQKELVKLIANGKGLESLNTPPSAGLKKAVKQQVDELDIIVKKVQALPDEIKNGPQNIVPLNIEFKLPDGKLPKMLADVSDQINAFMVEMAQTLAVGFGELLGGALANTGSIGDFFNGIFASLGAGLKQLGTYFIKTAIQIKAIKSFLLKNPALAIAGGIALIAIGSLIQSKSTPGFANGVENFRGGYATVGERGPERVFLPSGSSVIPNESLSGINGGSSVQVTGTIRANGKDLVVLIDNSRQSLNRQV